MMLKGLCEERQKKWKGENRSCWMDVYEASSGSRKRRLVNRAVRVMNSIKVKSNSDMTAF